MAAAKTKIGIIGCGNCLPLYATTAARMEILELVACADLLPERARARAEEFSIPTACSVDELLAIPDLEIVVNLTPPQAHAAVALSALRAGKHVFNEKPLVVTREEGQELLALAEQKGLLVGSAPDTFLGAAGQTARKLLDDGWIGEPVGVSCYMMNRGPEDWHPDPDFFYHPGGGSLFDRGPYYLMSLTNLLGPVSSVTASAGITFPERLITSQPHYGELIRPDVPTHVNGILHFAGGAVGTMTMSYDVWATTHEAIEIYGTEGTLVLPDPNDFGGPVRLWRPGQKDWQLVPATHGYSEQSRGLGVADMAYALRSGRPHRSSGALAYHVLDVMHTLHEAAEQGCRLPVASTVARPAALPVGLRAGTLDE